MAEASRQPWDIESLFLMITTSCNLRCEYCMLQGSTRSRMPWPAIEAALAHLRASPRRSVHLMLTGGEPLLESSMLRETIDLAQVAATPGRAVAIDVLSNGTLLDEGTADFLATRDVGLQLSLDGAPEAQRLRGEWTSGALEALVKRLSAHQPEWYSRRFSVAVTLVPETVPHLADSIDYLVEIGAREIGISPALGHSAGWTSDMEGVLDDQFRRLWEGSLTQMQRRGHSPVVLFRPDSLSPQPSSSGRCGVPGATMAVVDVDGAVYGCPPAARSAFGGSTSLPRAFADALQLGDIRDPELGARVPAFRRRLLATGLFERRDIDYSVSGPCRRCVWVQECQACPLSSVLGPGATDIRRVPDFICAFNRVSLKHRRRFLEATQ